ncbi:hypothetical protein F5Y05DRAFT_415314 [Hypoxylon sp. FL0543]|nr:hypothetical protein F5Y05DRAFT_415314 [Hypoxylon sp. FL0543]
MEPTPEPDGITHSTPVDESPSQLCTICQDDEDKTAPIILPCGHAFHTACVLQWLEAAADVQKCPNCRCPIAYDCSHAIDLEHFEAGADLRDTVSTIFNCGDCDDMGEIIEMMELIAEVWWLVQFLYLQRSNCANEFALPVDMNPETFDRAEKQRFRRRCIELRNWLQKSVDAITTAWVEIGKAIIDMDYDELLSGPRDELPRRTLQQLIDAFPPENDPSPVNDDGNDNLDEWEEPSPRDIRALHILLYQILRGMNADHVDGLLCDLNDKLQLQYEIELELYP